MHIATAAAALEHNTSGYHFPSAGDERCVSAAGSAAAAVGRRGIGASLTGAVIAEEINSTTHKHTLKTPTAVTRLWTPRQGVTLSPIS